MKKKIALVIALGMLSLESFSAGNPNPANGEKIFKQNCTACHSIGKGKIVGPDLKGVNERRSEAWLLRFIKSSQSVVKSGDKTAVALFNQHNKIQMPDQNLSNDQIKDVLAFIKSVK